MKYFVTGGTGHIGSELVQSLVNSNHEVSVLTRQRHPHMIDGASYIIGDLLDTERYGRELEDAVVVHLAADVRIGVLGEREKMDIFRTNYVGTEELLDAFERHGGRHLIYLSSRQVYGHENIDEDTPLDGKGTSVYAHSKVLAHRAVRRSGIDWTVLIPGMVYSREQRSTGVNYVYRMFRQGLKLGFGLDKRNSYTYLEDLITAVEKVAGNPEAFHREYIISNGSMTTRDLYSVFEEVSGVRAPKREVPRWVLSSVSRVLTHMTRLTGRRFLLNQETLNNASITTVMDNSRSIKELGMKYSPLRDTIVSCLEGIEGRKIQRVRVKRTLPVSISS